MVDIKTVAAATVIGRIVNETLDSAAQAAETDTDGSQQDETQNGVGGTGDMNDGSTDALERLVAFKERHEPAPNAVDAYASQTLNLTNGEIVEVEVTPASGFNLEVKKATFDRRDDHNYSFLIDGQGLSSNHNLELTAPRKMSQGGKLVGVVENASGSASELDFEFLGWAEEP